MKDLLEILKSLTTSLADGLKDLSEGNVDSAVEKITSVVPLLKTATETAETIDAEAQATEVELEKTKAGNMELIQKVAENPDALQAIEKWVNLGISGDKMETILSDIKALSEALGAGGLDNLVKTLEDVKETKDLVEKLAKKVNVSKQVVSGGEDDEEDDDKTPVTKFKSFRA